MTFLIAYLVGVGCFAVCLLATLGTDRLTPTAPRDEKGPAP